MRKFLTSFAFVIGVFISGLIFGLGYQEDFTKSVVRTAYNYGFEQGRESLLLAVINGEVVEVASRD